MSCVELNPEVISAIDCLKETYHCPNIMWLGTDVEITVVENPACCETLILRNAWGLPKDFRLYNKFVGCFYINEFQRENDHFRLTFLYETLDMEEPAQHSICFADADVKRAFFDASSSFLAGNPWVSFANLSIWLTRRHTLGALCNPLEADLLPILREITDFYWSPSFKAYPLLKELLLRHGHSREAALLSRLESAEKANRRQHMLTSLVKMLAKRRFESMWRELYDRFSSSQQGLPSIGEARSDPALLSETRAEIQAFMELQGFSGTYPDFSRTTALSGISAFFFHGQIFPPFSAPRVHRFVHCAEFPMGSDALHISFLRGAVFAKKGDAEPDIFSCIFAAGYRRFSAFVPSVVCPPDTVHDTLSLEEGMKIAVIGPESRLRKQH